jgi:hypothetical protein
MRAGLVKAKLSHRAPDPERFVDSSQVTRQCRHLQVPATPRRQVAIQANQHAVVIRRDAE